MLTSELCWKIFDQCIDTYHQYDNVDQPLENPFTDKLEALLYHKNWIDTVQWHLEDICRDPKVSDADMAALKRRIDKSNQERTDKVEQLDDWIIDSFKHVQVASDAPLNTESPAWVIDRLSILALKIFHMREQVERQDVDQEHIQKCRNKLDVLLDQKIDLSQSFDDFMSDIANGRKRVKVYRQMKMYNDEKLNPALYKK